MQAMASFFQHRVKKPALFYAVSLGATAALSLLGVASGRPLLLAVLNLIVPLAILFHFLRKEEVRRATGALLVWTYALGFFMVLWVCLFPERAESAIFHGAAYKEEMFHWIETGEGAESRPAQFIPQHLLHVGAFLALSALSCSVLGLLMGVLLVDYMAFYTGSVILAAEHNGLAALLAWHPWSLLRMAAFVLLGVVVASLVYGKLRGRTLPSGACPPAAGAGERWRAHRGRLLWAAALLALDIALKAALAPLWREWLLLGAGFH